MGFNRKDLLGIRDLEVSEIEHILESAMSFKEINARSIKKVPTLRGKTVITLFYEPSTRTRTSFDIAAKRLSADTYSITGSTSSMVKGETLLDTLRNLEAMQADVFVIRHSASGAPHMLAGRTPASVINAGDGMHEHPSQALLDMLTIREHKEAPGRSQRGHSGGYLSQPRSALQYLGASKNGLPCDGMRPHDAYPAPNRSHGRRSLQSARGLHSRCRRHNGFATAKREAAADAPALPARVLGLFRHQTAPG